MKGNISTRAGDKGTTGIGGGDRVSKSNLRIHCLGDLDEATEHLEMAMEIRHRLLKDQHPSTLESMHDLGILGREFPKYL